MKPAAETNSQDGARPGSGRPAKRRWPLIAAIGLAVIAALILVYEMATILNQQRRASPLRSRARRFR